MGRTPSHYVLITAGGGRRAKNAGTRGAPQKIREEVYAQKIREQYAASGSQLQRYALHMHANKRTNQGIISGHSSQL